ncbi:DUF2523 domain-containing protein [Haemophilus haemoglobinophilus]|nr:DUF2523 domain-containing protein [Canicola haemoglobinophilus]MBN6711816.1 DUF2523 domain-containing protein [Canicola haemoglobinophilus]
MGAILINGLIKLLGFVFKGSVSKFFLFYGLYYITSEFVPILVSFMDLNFSSVGSLLNSIDSGIWYFLNIFRFSDGMYIVFSAYVTRFIIRRIPIIG